mgnify:FL=1|jgi:hypothetical protein
MARIIKGSKPDYIKNLKPIHRLMAMKTACFGYRPVQLSGAFGYSLRQVTRIINSDPFREYESVLMKKAEDALLAVMINDN